MAAHPTKLGRYEIVEEIGKGAMGVVYLARDPLIGRLVALKTFRVGYSAKDEELRQFRSRFIREAQSAGILSHPSIVTIHDVVEASEEGATFIAMEYVRGTNLKELLQRDRPLELRFVVEVIGQVADALDYAHAKGVVHRDIKPANIIITPDERVKITDFGIARLNTSNLTFEGQLLGTPNYMAPEQILGKEVDQRADVFSLGVVLYELVTRRKPFQGDNLTVVTHRIAYEPFTPPEEIVPGLPSPVRSVLDRALEKDPARRYPRASQMAEELRRALPAPPNLNDTLSAELPAPPPLKRRRGWAERLLGAADARPPDAERRSASARLVVVALSALSAALVVALTALLLLPADGVLVTPAGAAERQRLELLPLLQEGHRRLLAGDAAGAAQAFAAAERLAPARPAIRRQRLAAETQAAQSATAGGQAAALAVELAGGREALARSRYDQARDAARRALAIAPEDAAARALLADAESGLARRAARSRTPLPRPGTTPPEAAAPVAPAAAPTLDVDFFTERPEGSLTIYAGPRQVLREPFRWRRSRLFRGEGLSGGIEAHLELPPGPTKLRVYVALAGEDTQTIHLEGNFPAGSSRRLVVRVDAQGVATAVLE